MASEQKKRDKSEKIRQYREVIKVSGINSC